MNNWYGKDRYNKDRNMQGRSDRSNPDQTYRRPSERYDREEYYRNGNPDHWETNDEESRWHYAGKFEDKSDPGYSYGTRERDMMREYPAYPTNERQYYQRHPRPEDESTFDFLYEEDAWAMPNFTGRGPKNWKRSDESIRDQVCHALEVEPRIDASEIEVDVKDGIVTLRGNIHDRPAKRIAEDTIDYLPGVLDVQNQLTVDKSFFERAKEFLTGGSDATEKPRKARH